MLKWIKNKLKKNNNKMVSEEKLINYKQNFMGVKFQWIKPIDPTLLGKVVICRDILFKGNNVYAVFDDKSQVLVSKINSDLLMIHGEMQSLTKEEVNSIYGSKRTSGSINTEPTKIETEPTANVDIAPKTTVMAPADNPFKMFNSDESDLLIKVKINLPDKKLLKLMYNNAEDKQKFLNQLSNFVLSMINNKVVQESLSSILETKPVTKKKVANIKLIEIDDEK